VTICECKHELTAHTIPFYIGVTYCWGCSATGCGCKEFSWGRS